MHREVSGRVSRVALDGLAFEALPAHAPSLPALCGPPGSQGRREQGQAAHADPQPGERGQGGPRGSLFPRPPSLAGGRRGRTLHWASSCTPSLGTGGQTRQPPKMDRHTPAPPPKKPFHPSSAGAASAAPPRAAVRGDPGTDLPPPRSLGAAPRTGVSPGSRCGLHVCPLCPAAAAQGVYKRPEETSGNGREQLELGPSPSRPRPRPGAGAGREGGPGTAPSGPLVLPCCSLLHYRSGQQFPGCAAVCPPRAGPDPWEWG